MTRVLLTGMSGTGKSTVINRLGELGYKADDLVALMHELIQRQAAICQHQATLVQLQTESVHLQRRLIECMLTTRTVDPDVTVDGRCAERPPLDQSLHASPARASLVAAQAAVAMRRPLPRSLTCREREVAVLLAKGLTNRQIAVQLVIAERTADTHVQNLLAKLGCASRKDVAALLTADLSRGPTPV